MYRYIKEDSNKIYFIFLVLLDFIRILEVYTNFWSFKRKQKLEKQSYGAGPAFQPGARHCCLAQRPKQPEWPSRPARCGKPRARSPRAWLPVTHRWTRGGEVLGGASVERGGSAG
jgi:hypothetical protein